MGEELVGFNDRYSSTLLYLTSCNVNVVERRHSDIYKNCPLVAELDFEELWEMKEPVINLVII